MNRRPRCTHSTAFKTRVTLAAVRGDRALDELAQQQDAHPNQITDWKNQLLAKTADVRERCPRRHRQLHHPWAYLKDVLTQLPTQPNSRIDELLPHLWTTRA